jgi:HPt (histidine-containing phosphotransfer) domain-containing protein
VVSILTAIQKDRESSEDVLWQESKTSNFTKSIDFLNLDSPTSIYKDEKTLSQVLQKFVLIYTPVLARLKSEDVDDSELQSITHKMLGSAASLGLEKLAFICHQFESFFIGVLDQMPDLDQLIDILEQSLAAASQHVLIDTVKDDSHNINPQKLDEILSEGEKALSLHDINQIEIFMETLQANHLNDLYTKIQPSIALYDFNHAKRILEDVRVGLKLVSEEITK